MLGLILLALFFVSFIYFGFMTWSYPLFSPDEPRYAETAREMLESLNFVVPYCNYIPRFDKPALFYWLIVLSYKIFGLNEFAARLPSILAASALVPLSFILGNLHGFGLISAMIALSTFAFFFFAKIAITDMVLCFCISASLVCFYLGYLQITNQKMEFGFRDKASSPVWIQLSMVMVGLGFLCKGPIAIALPFLIVLIFLLLQKKLLEFVQVTWPQLLWGGLWVLVINLPWYALVHLLTNGTFSQEFFMSHNVNRFFAAHTGHGAPLWFYLPVIFVGLVPWSFFLPQALVSVDFSKRFNLQSERAKDLQTHNFCLVWFLVTFIIFTIARTKLPAYVLPGFLPLVFILARWWSDKFKTTRSNSSANNDALLGLILLFVSLIGFLFAYFFIIKARLISIDGTGLVIPIIAMSFVFLAATLIALTAIKSNARISFALIFAASCVVQLCFVVACMRPFIKMRDGGSKAFAVSLQPGDKLATYFTHANRFAFYAQRPVTLLNNKNLSAYVSESQPKRYLVLRTKHKPKLTKRLTKLNMQDVLLFQSSNPVYTYTRVRIN